MRPARIPSAPHFALGRSICGVLGLLLLGCSSASDNTPKGIIPGMALGKLCHDLNRGGLPITLTLQFGDPAISSITARTGVCAPFKGTPCASIPVGLVPLRVMEGDKLLATRSVLLSHGDGGAPNEYVFQPIINNAGTQVVIVGGPIRFPDTCETLDFPPPDGGVRDGAGGGEGGAVDAGAVDGSAPDAAAADAPAPADAAVDAPVPADAAPAVDAPEDAPTSVADGPTD